MDPKFVVVVGTSAGGVNALTEFVSQLKPEMNASVFIVMHLSGTVNKDFLSNRLQRFTSLPCKTATDQAVISRGTIYVAPPGQHLIIKEGMTVLGYGPEENRWCPSIDVLFRSAAAVYANHAIGVVLTGLLNDGATGMLAIKRSGGICIIQDPAEAQYASMPLAVLKDIEVDYSISVAEMGPALETLTRNGIS